MEHCEGVHVDEENIGSHVVSVEKETAHNEDGDKVVCDECIAGITAVDHLEDDEEDFEDALDNLDSSVTEDEHADVSSYDAPAVHEINIFEPSSSNEGISDSRHSSVSEDENVLGDKQETASETMRVDEEVLREKEACLTEEEKQVMH